MLEKTPCHLGWRGGAEAARSLLRVRRERELGDEQEQAATGFPGAIDSSPLVVGKDAVGQERSSSRSAAAVSSPLLTPIRARMPRSISPTISPFTRTSAE